ncbi:MAG TPA: GNAT family N-acetyltransferase [Longimicrobiaceae bacterium]|nr:GNAT family N-acetyltransferase [Longimicrobiaceae bacterium]
MGAFEARWRGILRQATRSTRVGVVDGELVGFASVGTSRDADAVPPRTGELYALYLDPRFWGRGMGCALWNAALQVLLADEFTEVTLWVLEANARGRDFYERVGFQLDEGAVKVLEREGAELPEVRYRMPLAPGGT